MREINVKIIEEAVKSLLTEANYVIGDDVRAAVSCARDLEKSGTARGVLDQLLENYDIAKNERVAICQDTGMAVLFIDLGQDVHLTGGNLEEAVNSGVRAAYRDGYLRKSVVAEPVFDRKNTGDNTPAVLHLRLVPGENVHILVTAKGFGSENMSRVKMLVPADGEKGVEDFIVETVKLAGPNPCPPVVVGVGVGGTMEQAAILAKRMTARAVGSRHPDPRYAALERRALDRCNRLGIGAAGIGGVTTALAVNIDYAPTHIAGLPVAVNICCHAARHAETTL